MLSLVLLIIAFVLLLLAALPKVPQPFPFLPMGLALWCLSQFIGALIPALR